MSAELHNAEKTLQALQKRRSTPACYPCFKRKVKCRGGRPCEACVERQHPEICHVEELSKGSRRHPKGKAKAAATAHVRQSNQILDELAVGDLSSFKFIETWLGSYGGKFETLSATGIANSAVPIHLTMLGGFANNQNEMRPLRSEILQFYAPFRDLVMPLYPLVPNPTSFESLVKDLLLFPMSANLNPQEIAVVLACLALGAQFTEAHVDKRWGISQDFIVRANVSLQKADSIFKPSTEVVQALLMIGLALQNLGLSNGAWNLLGLTHRCAQSLDLHKCTSNDKTGREGAMLWTAVIWQDALMSLRYDRTPLTQSQQENGSTEYIQQGLQPYHETINKLHCVTINILHQPTTWRSDPQNILPKIEYLERVITTAPEYLNAFWSARTFQQEFQYYAIRQHSSMLTAELCRPFFNNHEGGLDGIQKVIRQKGMQSLLTVVESFLNLCALSNIPFRSWSLLQAAISCALVLALVDSRNPQPGTQRLLRRFVDTLRIGDISETARIDSNLEKSHLFEMQENSIKFLQSVLNRTAGAVAQETRVSPILTALREGSAEVPVSINNFDLELDGFLNWPAELSLFDGTFPDAILEANLHES